MNKIVYLDSSSTSIPKYFAKDYVQYFMNSNTNYAYIEQGKLAEVRDRIKRAIGVKSGKVIVGAEASQMMETIAYATLKNFGAFKINTNFMGSVYEHDAVRNTEFAEFRNSVELFGHLDKDIEYSVKMINWQYINNVTGWKFPVEITGKKVQETGRYFICDMTSTVGKYPIPKNIEQWCDCCFASAHKWHGEKNQGFMWLSDRFAKYLGLSEYPKNEYGLREGTTDVPGALAMTDALEHATSFINLEAGQEHYRQLHDYLFTCTQSKGLHLIEKVAGCGAIVAVTVPFCNADALQMYLASKGIYISVGHSACSEDSNYRVLEAFGYTKEEASQTIRVSFDEDTGYADIEALVDGIVEFKKRFC